LWLKRTWTLVSFTVFTKVYTEAELAPSSAIISESPFAELSWSERCSRLMG